MPGADHEAHDVRKHQPHEPDHAAHRDGHPHQHRDHDEHQLPEPVHVQAECPGALVTGEQQVEFAGPSQQQHQARDQDDRGAEQQLPAGRAEPAEGPEQHLRGEGGTGCGEHQQAGQRGQHRPDRDTTEDQPQHGDPAGRAGDRQDHGQRRQCPGEGRDVERQRPGPEQPEPHHDDGAGRGARGDPDDARTGERVADHRLQDHPGHRECRPDEGGQQDPGQPGVGDDEVLRTGPVRGGDQGGPAEAVREDPPGLRPRHRHRSGRERRPGDGDEQHREPGDDQGQRVPSRGPCDGTGGGAAREGAVGPQDGDELGAPGHRKRSGCRSRASCSTASTDRGPGWASDSATVGNAPVARAGTAAIASVDRSVAIFDSTLGSR